MDIYITNLVQIIMWSFVGHRGFCWLSCKRVNTMFGWTRERWKYGLKPFLKGYILHKEKRNKIWMVSKHRRAIIFFFSFMVLFQYVSIYSKGVTGIWYLVLLYIVRNILARGSVGYIMRLDFIWNKDKLLFFSCYTKIIYWLLRRDFKIILYIYFFQRKWFA